MAEPVAERAVLDALLAGLAKQGHASASAPGDTALRAYPIAGTVDVLALAEAVENALGGTTSDEEAKTSAELNAANDG